MIRIPYSQLLHASWIVILFLCSASCLYAQTDEDVEEAIFNSVLGRQFTKIVTGNTSVPGNYASFDIKEAQLNGAGIGKIGNESLISFKVGAGITEGTSALFSNSNVNPNVSFEINYNFLSPFGKKTIITNTDEKEAIKRRMESIERYYTVELSEMALKQKYYDNLFSLFSDSVAVILGAIVQTETDIVKQPDPIKQRKLKIKLSKLIESSYKMQHHRDSMEVLKNNPITQRQITNDRNIKWAKVPDQLNPTGLSINWFNIGYKLVNKNFYLFDPLKIYSEQVSKENFTAHQLSVSYNHYSWRNGFGSWFFSFGLSFLLDDTKSNLNKTEITETITYSAPPNARSEQKKYTAYTGDYKKDIQVLKPYIEFYYFLTKNQLMALHMYPNLEFSKDNTLTNIGTGLFFTFNDKNNKEGKAKVNAELYCKFNDINNNLKKQGSRFLDRNDIGVRLTFPFNFNP